MMVDMAFGRDMHVGSLSHRMGLDLAFWIPCWANFRRLDNEERYLDISLDTLACIRRPSVQTGNMG